MNVTIQENESYRAFVSEVAQQMGVFDFQPEQIVWHYTNGAGFLGIIESATIRATQVASLNDKGETKYATDLYKEAIHEVLKDKADDAEAVGFLKMVLEFVKDEPESPAHGASKFFVVCFSGDEDELTQWDRYCKPNGYALGFVARGLYREPNSQLYRVVYDRTKQLNATKRIAAATLDFYREGLTGDRLENPSEWGKIFIEAWDEWVYKLAPLAKDSKWKSENEYRLVHELKVSEIPNLRFIQKPSMPGHYAWIVFVTCKQVAVEVVVTRVTVSTVSYIAVDCSISGTLPQWLFLQDFEPVTGRKKKGS